MSRGPPTNGNGHELYNPYLSASDFSQGQPSRSKWHQGDFPPAAEEGLELFPDAGGPQYPESHLYPTYPHQNDIVQGSASPSPLKIKLKFNSQRTTAATSDPNMVATRGRASTNGHVEQQQSMQQASGSEFDEDAVGEEDDCTSHALVAQTHLRRLFRTCEAS